MALTLRMRSGDVDPEPELPFDAPRVLVGRAPGCDLQLPDPSVSPRHASIRQRGSDYVLVDEGSDNGTFVADAPLVGHAPHVLSDGELLRFGRVWVEVRLGPAEHPTEVQASRELARRLVDAALAADDKPYGMLVRCEGVEEPLCLEEPRHPYLVGSKKGADLRLPSGSPSRALELRRQADQLWVTLLPGASAAVGERELVPGERTAWPKTAALTLGGLRFSVSDPTAQILERLEREPTERLAEGAAIDPPSGLSEAADDEEDEEEEADDDAGGDADEDEVDEEQDERGGDLAVAAPGAVAAGQSRPRTSGGSWTKLDAVVFLLAVSVLALSIWAIRWLARLGAA